MSGTEERDGTTESCLGAELPGRTGGDLPRGPDSRISPGSHTSPDRPDSPDSPDSSESPDRGWRTRSYVPASRRAPGSQAPEPIYSSLLESWHRQGRTVPGRPDPEWITLTADPDPNPNRSRGQGI